MADSRYERIEPIEGEFLFKLDPRTKRKKILTFYPTVEFADIPEEAWAELGLIEFPFKATDTLMGLAQKYYDDPAYWWVIALLNNVGCEQEIAVGDPLVVVTPLTGLLGTWGL